MFSALPNIRVSDTLPNLYFYPIGLSYSDFLQMFFDVDRYQISASSLSSSDPYLAFISAGGAAGNIIGTIDGLNAATSAISGARGFFTGETKRTWLAPQFETQHDLEIYQSRRINSDIGGPIHSFSGGFNLEIDMTLSLQFGGRYYPRITAFLSGITSSSSSFSVGYLSLDGLGLVPVYSDNPTLTFSGSMSRAFSYSRISARFRDGRITISDAEFGRLPQIKSAFCRGFSLKSELLSPNSITIQAPFSGLSELELLLQEGQGTSFNQYSVLASSVPQP
jgi:hypothetical protein